MRLSRQLLPMYLLAAAHTSPISPKIQWGPCEEGEFNTTLTIECGTLRVPLDYSLSNSSETIELAIVKIPAAVQPSRGSIQTNFGGPGELGRENLVGLGSILQPLSGGVYDLLAFDPRGVGKTIPFSCSNDSYVLGQMMTEIQSGIQSDTELKRLWARGEIDGNICRQQGDGNSTGELIGTGFTARDFLSIVDALGEDGMLRYWGFSYGTTLGATLAAMFPERIDKLIIDGVQNPHDYYHSHADFEEWTDSDMVFTYFFETCVQEGAKNCALATQNKTAIALEQDLWHFFDSIREAPIVAGTSILDLITAKGYVMESLKSTAGWPALAEFMAILVYGPEEAKPAAIEALIGPSTVAPESQNGPVKLYGIHCSDRLLRAKSFDEVAPSFEKLHQISRLMGDVVDHVTAHCAQWPWHAKGGYSGDFHVKTKNPILVVSNIRDAHTPLRSAQNVSSGFEGSGFLKVNGTGHTSLNAPSACVAKEVFAYWVNGSLPEVGKLCDAKAPWSNYTWKDVFSGSAGSP